MDPERRLFPGFVAVALAIVGLWPRTRKDARTRVFRARRPFAYALGLMLAFDVSLGFNGVIYRGLYDYFLPFKALRIPARMGLMVGFSLAVLAGYGATRIAERLRSATARRAVLTLIGAADAGRVRVDAARRCGRRRGSRRRPTPIWCATSATVRPR